MTEQELKQRIFQVYAALGELSVRRKQLLQNLEAMDQQIDHFEQEIVKLSTLNLITDKKEESK